jgi:flavin-binding protein dodecin
MLSVEDDMVYKYIDIVGTSPNGVDDAVKNAIDEAAITVKNLKWAELGRTTVRIEGQKIQEYQTEVRIGFKIERENND